MIALYILIPIAILFLAYLFLIAPKRDKGMKKYHGARFAHRGLHGEGAEENSITAFRRAVEAGHGIELDVRLSADGELVVFHDDTLTRVAKIDKKVRDLTVEELASVKLGDTEDTVPTFDEVLELVGGKVPLLVEIKEDQGDSSVSTKAAEVLAGYKGDFIVESFNPLSLRNFKAHLPGVPVGILSTYYLKEPKYRKPLYFLLQLMLFNFLFRPSFIAYNHLSYRSFSLRLARVLFGATCFAWTTRSDAEDGAALDHGFHGVIFERKMSS